MQISTRAIIIKRYKIGEADRLLLAFTEELGKILITAKSVRRPQSKLAGHIELFTPTKLEIVQGRGDYFKLVGAMHLDNFYRRRFDILNLRHLDTIAEIIDLALGDEQENKQAFLIFWQSILMIKHYPDDSYLISIEAIVKLLEAVGIRPELYFCTVCRQNIISDSVNWSSSSGGLICSNCKGSKIDSREIASNRSIVLLRLMQAQEIITNRITADKQYIEEASLIINDYLLTHLPRPLKTLHHNY